MRRFRLVALATVVAASLIAPSAILAAEPTTDSTDSAGGLAAPTPTPAPAPDAAATAPTEVPGAPPTDATDSGVAAAEVATGEGSGNEAALAEATVAAIPEAKSTRLAAKRESNLASTSATPAALVAIQDYLFSPKTVTINVGETVKWQNKGTVLEGHTVTADDNSFDSGVLKHGQSFTHKFSKAGSFAYVCTIHPNMIGKVVVSSTSAGGGSGGGSGGGGTTNSGFGTSSDTTSSAGSLPYTGQDLRVALVVGVNLLLAGTLLLLRSRFSGSR